MLWKNYVASANLEIAGGCYIQPGRRAKPTTPKLRGLATDVPALYIRSFLIYCALCRPLLADSTCRSQKASYDSMTIPPGISALATIISQASVLPLTLGTLDYFLLRPYGFHSLPKWVTIVTCFLSPLAAFSVQLLSGDLIVYIKAKRAGAVLPPHTPTWVPGAIHRILAISNAGETAFIGNISANCHSGNTDSSLKAISSRNGPEISDTLSTSGFCSTIRSVFLLPVRIDKGSNRPLSHRYLQQSRSTSKFALVSLLRILC